MVINTIPVGLQGHWMRTRLSNPSFVVIVKDWHLRGISFSIPTPHEYRWPRIFECVVIVVSNYSPLLFFTHLSCFHRSCNEVDRSHPQVPNYRSWCKPDSSLLSKWPMLMQWLFLNRKNSVVFFLVIFFLVNKSKEKQINLCVLRKSLVFNRLWRTLLSSRKDLS